MNRDVERGDVLLLDAPPVLFGQVRQGDEAAVEHRVAVVVVHDVERAAHSLGDLLDETERAGVFADADPVERRIGEGYAPEFVALELQVIAEQDAGAFDVEDDVLRLRLKLEVERVDQRQPIDADDAIARFDPSSIASEAGDTASTCPGTLGARSTRRWDSGLTATGLILIAVQCGKVGACQRSAPPALIRASGVCNAISLACSALRHPAHDVSDAGYTYAFSHEPGAPLAFPMR